MTDGAQFIAAIVVVFVAYELVLAALARFFNWYFQKRGPDTDE